MPEFVKEFATKTRIDVAAWSAVQTETSLMIDGIASRDHAERLHSFLSERGMLATMTMGDKRGATWVIVARDRIPGLLDDE